MHAMSKNKLGSKQNNKHQGKLHKLFFNEVIATDIVGPYSKSEFKKGEGKVYVITLIDMHFWLLKLYPTANATGTEFCQFFKDSWIKHFGPPKALLTDNGKQYVGNVLKLFCDTYKIKKLFSTPYNPTGNSIAGRINATITTSLKTLKNYKFENSIKVVEMAMNNSYHSSLHCFPFEFFNKKSVFDPMDRLLKFNSDYINGL